MATQSIKYLLQHVTPFADLERLEVLFIEIGQLKVEVLTAMELELQNVRNKLPMGGVFTIMTDDPKQLRPPEGSLEWLFPKTLTT